MNATAAALDEGRVQVQARRARPRLSVILLSSGPEHELERAVLSLSDTVFALGAQLVIARAEAPGAGRESVQRLAQMHRCAFAFENPGSPRGALSDAGMKLANGDIVAFREDSNVQDGDWLSVFARGIVVESAVEEEVAFSPSLVDERAAVTGSRTSERLVRLTHSTRGNVEAASDPVS